MLEWKKKMMKLFQKMSNNRSRCLLCSRYCELEHGEVGACHALKNREGEIYPHTYGILSSIAVEPIEKKPFKHFLPGTKTLSIGGFGCNLRCRYCESTIISQTDKHEGSKEFSIPKIIEIAKEKHCQSVCMTYNEPTIHFEFLLKLGKECHDNDLKFIIKTNAYINPDPWEEVCQVVDAINVDYKGFSHYFEDITECRYTDFAEKITTALDRGVHVELSVPIMPGYSNEDGYYFYPLSFCSELPCHLLKVNPAHLMINYPTTSDEDISAARKDLCHIFKDIYIY